MISFDNIAQQLHRTNITPSIQRIKIMEYLLACQCHPTAEQIYLSLKEHDLSISKATIYNTLTLFTEKGLVRILTLEGNENRFDIITDDHGHFICQKCGAISNFQAEPDQILCDELKDFLITQKDIYFRGVCPECIAK